MKKKTEIAISKFKATCLAVLEEVRKTGRPVRVTRFGKPVADIVPPAPAENDGSWLGCMAGSIDPEDLKELYAELEKHPLKMSSKAEEQWLARWDEQEKRASDASEQTSRGRKPT